MGIPMGIGLLGDPNLIIKRKFRWTLQFRLNCNGQIVEENFVKVAGRPNISIESTELNFLNEKNFIPGKATWETITVSYLDVAGNELLSLWDWLASVYDYTNKNRWMGAAQKDYTATGYLLLYSGCGDPLESWTLENAWPEAINFGDLDYSSSDPAEIELTLRYTGVQYHNYCGRDPLPCPCTPCGTPLASFGGPGGSPVAN